MATFGETTRRSFKGGEVVRGVLQIYQGTQRTDTLMPVVMRVRILDAKGMALRDQSLPFQESSFANRRTECVITLDAHAGRVSPSGRFLGQSAHQQPCPAIQGRVRQSTAAIQ